MRKHIGFIGIAGAFAAAATHAQIASLAGAVTAYDGTYAIVSVTKLTDRFNFQGRLVQCREVKGGPLTIANGQARYGDDTTGAVGPHGELVMREDGPPNGSEFTFDKTFSGVIDGTGTVRARRSGYGCLYDFVWRKMPK